MRVYYNEYEPSAAAWLRELMKDGLIPKGVVDERSIVDVQPGDLAGFDQCHFFAGIGGWPLALQLANWDPARPVWTGSCPCQPFSVAGKNKGVADERHLWPEFFRLIRECRPATIFGEQVASKAGRDWLAGVRADLEGVAYAVGAADLCAAGIGAPHIRQRLYWVADTISERGCRRDGKGQYAEHAIASGASDWQRSKWHNCRDQKYRRIPLEPGIFPLAHGIPGRVGLLRGAGNAIVPQVAAEFIEAYLNT